MSGNQIEGEDRVKVLEARNAIRNLAISDPKIRDALDGIARELDRFIMKTCPHGNEHKHIVPHPFWPGIVLETCNKCEAQWHRSQGD